MINDSDSFSTPAALSACEDTAADQSQGCSADRSSGRPTERTLSLILPAYNEATRLPGYLDAIRAYFSECYTGSYEVIVVDDGSEDDMAAVVLSQAKHWPQLRLVRQEFNQGKGAAVRAGFLAASGDLLLFADADGATPIAEEAKLRQALAAGADLAIGSRLVVDGDIQCERFWARGLMGKLFAAVVVYLFDLSIHDSQCGFKMVRRGPARQLVEVCRENGYLFDVELLAWARKLGYETVEVPVNWKDVPGSKVNLFRDGCRMLLGLFRIMQSLKSRTAPVVSECE